MVDWHASRSGSRSIVSWALVGLLLAIGAPLGLYLLLWLRGFDLSHAIAQVSLVYSWIGTSVVFTGLGVLAGRLMDRQRDAALRDGLTGLFNRRFLREILPQLQASSARRGTPLCVIMLDLDHFKAVNDSHGHLVGDQTLRAVAEALNAHSRRSDLVARYGGEEFVVLCPDTDSETGFVVAERLREAIASLRAPELGHPGPQTVSLGVAVQPATMSISPEKLLDHADAALYLAKDGGRNRTLAKVIEGG